MSSPSFVKVSKINGDPYEVDGAKFLLFVTLLRSHKLFSLWPSEGNILIKLRIFSIGQKVVAEVANKLPILWGAFLTNWQHQLFQSLISQVPNPSPFSRSNLFLYQAFSLAIGEDFVERGTLLLEDHFLNLDEPKGSESTACSPFKLAATLCHARK